MRATLRMVLYLLAFALGGLFLAYYIRPDWFAHVVRFEQEHPQEARLLAAGLATVLTLSPLSILLRWLQVHRHARDISYTTDSGRVSVNLVAVEEALTRALEHEDCVKKAKVLVYEDRVKRMVVIESAMTFWEVPNVTERNRQCQQILRRRFAELMPEQTAVQVNLNVHRITPRREEPRRKDKAAEPAREAVPAPAPAPAVDQRPPPNPFAGTPLEGEHGDWRRPEPATPTPARVVPTDEDGLYVGPSYPVERDEDDSGENNAIGRPIPVSRPKT